MLQIPALAGKAPVQVVHVFLNFLWDPEVVNSDMLFDERFSSELFPMDMQSE